MRVASPSQYPCMYSKRDRESLKTPCVCFACCSRVPRLHEYCTSVLFTTLIASVDELISLILDHNYTYWFHHRRKSNINAANKSVSQSWIKNLAMDTCTCTHPSYNVSWLGSAVRITEPFFNLLLNNPCWPLLHIHRQVHVVSYPAAKAQSTFFLKEHKTAPLSSPLLMPAVGVCW